MERKDPLFAGIDDEFTKPASEGVVGDTVSWIDTGSYSLNMLLSGDFYKGIAGNKVTGLAGLQATGKTFFVLSILANFQKMHKDGTVILFESEGGNNYKNVG